MSRDQIKRGLRGVRKHLRKILDDGSLGVIDDALAFVDSSFAQYSAAHGRTHHRGLVVPPWGFEIPKSRPIKFKSSDVLSGHRPVVDIHCVIYWRQEDDPPIKQNVAVRVWTKEFDRAYREEWDSPYVLERLEASGSSSRVMLRMHFDKAEPNQRAPEYHLQLGGNADPDELCWHPEELNIPRLAFHPVDFVLACQIVAANFFPNHYEEIRKSPEWKSIVRASQDQFLGTYYSNCVESLAEERLLLDDLWKFD